MLLAFALLAAGCGSSHHSGAPKAQPTTTTSSTTTAPSTSGDVAAIKADWTAFFAASTPMSRRITLLEDGSAFAAVIRTALSSPLAKGVSAQVSKVTVSSPTSATVVYSVIDDKVLVLRNQSGTSVLENGLWKVGVSSFCGLLRLEDTGSSSSLPTACSTSS